MVYNIYIYIYIYIYRYPSRRAAVRYVWEAGPTYPEDSFQGRGLVTTAGHKHLAPVMATLRHLREEPPLY